MLLDAYGNNLVLFGSISLEVAGARVAQLAVINVDKKFSSHTATPWNDFLAHAKKRGDCAEALQWWEGDDR